MKVEKVIKTVGRYTLLRTDEKYQPWVVAWGYDPTSQSWGQGHYFCRRVNAQHFFHKKAIAERRAGRN